MANLHPMSDDQAGCGRATAPDSCISDVHSTDKAERSTELVELLYLLKLGVKTNLRWLGRDTPDINAARKTSARLSDYVDRLEALIGSNAMNCSDRS